MMNENTTNDPIRVIGEFRAVSGAETQVMQALTQLQQPSLLQEGCLNFQIQQDDSDPQNFFVVSQWDSEDNLQHHTHKMGVLRSALLRLDTKLTEAKWLLSNLDGDA